MQLAAVAVLLMAVNYVSGQSACPGLGPKVVSGFSIYDVDECQTNNGGCDAHATCTNSIGGFSCACNSGYNGDGRTCTPTISCSVQVQSYTYHCDPNCTPFCAGDHSSMTGYIKVNGVTAATGDWCANSNVAGQANNDNGVNLVTVDPVSCKSTKSTNYNTYGSAADASALATLLTTAPKGTIFAASTQDEPQGNIKNAVAALKSACNVDVSDLQFRGSFAFVCQIGYPFKTVWAKTGTRQVNGAAVKVTLTGASATDVTISSN